MVDPRLEIIIETPKEQSDVEMDNFSDALKRVSSAAEGEERVVEFG
jgi:hypothetical protein